MTIVYVTPHDIETCLRKRHHPTAAKARKVLKRRGSKRNHAVEVYQCPVCLDWCLGGKYHKTVEELLCPTYADYNSQPSVTA